tara:strand:+ start:496 stop:783 length:288 start_codon:yes stop_codon:yes gene_type:complete
METTNQIEKALMKKVDVEIEDIVEQFTNACSSLEKKYGGRCFQNFEFKDQNKEQKITTLREHDVKYILFTSLKEKYGENMLKKKSEELIAKLDLI